MTNIVIEEAKDNIIITNRDMMKAIFPNGKEEKFKTYIRFLLDDDYYIICDINWWNAPYIR